MAAKPARRSRGGASLVAAGILVSRLTGLLRESVFAQYFGLSMPAGAFRQAFRIPNFLQNLFGEGVLSASFIPVYAGLLARREKELSQQVAGAVASILALVSSIIVLLDVIAPGFKGEKRDLVIRLVRIFFPGGGLLVMSAWCLGILNSHRKFFLTYVSPVVWNLAIIAGLIAFGRHSSL